MNRIGIRPNRVLAVLAALLIVTAGIATALAQSLGPAGPSPASDNASVVSQAVVDLPGGQTVWRIRNTEVNDAQAPMQNPYPAFVTTEGVPVLVSDDDRNFRQRIASGEATVIMPWHDMTIRSLGPPQTVLLLDVLPVDEATLSGSAGSISSPFDVAAGNYDVDLIRVSLDDGESSQVPRGNGPSLVIVRGGQANFDNTDEAFDLNAGGNRVVGGDLTVTATQDDTTVLVARIGPDVSTFATPSSAESEAATPAPASPEATPAPATPAASPAASPVPQDIDSDGDGLVNADEIAIGTDPDNPDTDGDGLTDGEEVELGTDPLVADTDEDGINDGDEVNVYGTDPLNVDTDGDILYDGGELLYGTDPLDPDTDGDGLSDGEEVYYYGTDPTNPDTDGDGTNDFNDPDTYAGEGAGGEAGAITGDLAVADTDNDGLPDHMEPRLGTNPLVWDSDGDGVRDAGEIALG